MSYCRNIFKEGFSNHEVKNKENKFSTKMFARRHPGLEFPLEKVSHLQSLFMLKIIFEHSKWNFNSKNL